MSSACLQQCSTASDACSVAYTPEAFHTIILSLLFRYTATVFSSHTTGPSYPTVKLHHAILATALMKLGFERLRTDSLALWERSERKWQRENGCGENES